MPVKENRATRVLLKLAASCVSCVEQFVVFVHVDLYGTEHFEVGSHELDIKQGEVFLFEMV